MRSATAGRGEARDDRKRKEMKKKIPIFFKVLVVRNFVIVRGDGRTMLSVRRKENTKRLEAWVLAFARMTEKKKVTDRGIRIMRKERQEKKINPGSRVEARDDRKRKEMKKKTQNIFQINYRFYLKNVL
jgi:hypothetical protein